MDEVKGFHPVIEIALNRAIKQAGYTNDLMVKHHAQTPDGTEVDFVIFLKATDRPVLVLEVKRTKVDCDSRRFWSQVRNYVEAFSTSWEPGYHKYYAITNVERLFVFCNRGGPVWASALAGNPFVDTDFGPPGSNNADKALLEFMDSMKRLLVLLMQKVKPTWAETWKLVLDSFETNYNSIRQCLTTYNKIMARDVTSYELLRILLYAYLREFYELHHSRNLQVFQTLPQKTTPPKGFVNALLNSYRRILNLDFEQIFKDHPDKSLRLLPERASIEITSYLNDFVLNASRSLKEAVKENSLPSYMIRIINDQIYSREEMHEEGKITTDEELASLLAELCIENPDTKIIDVGTGTGALSCAAYDRIKQLAISSKREKTHNQILSQIFGIERDSFLNQLATFQLISRNSAAVDTSTRANLEVGDAFDNPKREQFDALLMNPPFLRHDNKIVPITNKMEGHMLAAIEKQYGESSFVREATQPNLYFYFLNWAPHYLKTGGVAGIIVMAKFLNNVDGEYVKKFLLSSLESIVFYPREYFEEFKSTTCIVILRRGSQKQNVSFLRIKDPKLLEDPQKIGQILQSKAETIRPDFTLKQIPKHELRPSENWLVYFTDPRGKREFLDKLEILTPLNTMFPAKAKRGRAGNRGGTDAIFLGCRTNPLRNYVEQVEKRFIIPGLLRNKISNGRRHFILTKDDVTDQEALGIPTEFDDRTKIGLPPEYSKHKGLKQYCAEASKEYGDDWKAIFNDMFNSEVSPDLILPRADREKHSVYYWGKDRQLMISTNFFYLEGFKAIAGKGSRETQLKCICGYLLSTFGQIQFELKGNNQEGMRKIEGFMIDEFKCLDLGKLEPNEIETIAKAFEEFDALDADVKGNEGVYTSRRKLDKAIGETIFSRNRGEFSSVEALVDEFELFLAELVQMREM